MKKLLLSLILIIPALLANAQGPIKTWNDQLDDFISTFNQLDPALENLYSENGISSFTFTYFEPESGNVVKESSIFSADSFNQVNDQLMAQAKKMVTDYLDEAASTNSRLNSIIKEFEKKKTDIVLLYSFDDNGKKLTKEITIHPSELK